MVYNIFVFSFISFEDIQTYCVTFLQFILVIFGKIIQIREGVVKSTTTTNNLLKLCFFLQFFSNVLVFITTKYKF